MTRRHSLVVGSLLAAVGVALGAYGAHGLEDRLLSLGYEAELTQRLAWFETGVKYQLYHALGILIAAGALKGNRTVVAFLLGILLFCGSLYAMTFLSADWKKLGAVVPIGGLSFIVGWVLCAVGYWRSAAE